MLAGFGFVNNVGLVVTGVDKNKSFWYEIDFVWEERKWRYKTIEEFPGNLYALNKNDILIKLQREDPTKANETLGTWLSPNGNKLNNCSSKQEHLRRCYKSGESLRRML